ncbi:lipocalin family protein [Thaumasiovibrio subtropicus]|uniref:lipocalin family protein n=1 Tax=Thaumasiovibrio subtropicus TaxID=1891207 RepID=UPI000B359186|nr:lipocalin family protein [Thaumasiovibrio subtropicus]
MVFRLIAGFMLLMSAFVAKADDLTEFDYPLLLGDWYWFSPSEDGIESQGKQYRAMHVKFVSDYTYAIRLLRVDGEIDGWNGLYDIDEDNLSLTAEGHPTQTHDYQLSYNQFLLDGARFTKLAPENLPGEWVSSSVDGVDVIGEVKMAINLRPDFLFSFSTQDGSGRFIEHRGIYFIEDDHLVLIYEDGQHDSRYSLASDTLTLSNEQFGMEAVFERQ